MESSLKNLINYLQDNVIDLNDDNEISETLVKYIENDKNYCEKIKNIINSHKDDDWEGAEFVDEFNDDFGIELPNYDVLDAMETNEIPNEFAINIISPDECFKTLNVTLKDNNGALEIEDKTPGSQVNIKNNQDNDTRLADYYYDLGVKTGQKMYFEMAKRLKDQANMQALNDLLKKAENTPDDEDDEDEDIDTSDIDEDNKFVMEVITKDYICNEEGYWGKDDWDDLVNDGNILCYIYDANEEPIPDFSPDWLYKILGKYENIPGGYCLEDMESTFIVSKETYDALAKDPHCDSADDYTDCGYNYNEDNEDDENSDLSDIVFKGWNLHMPIKHGGRKAPKGGKEHLEFLRYDRNCNFYNFLLSDETDDFDGHGKHVNLMTMNKWAIKDIDEKIDWSAENAEIIQFGTTKSGIDYVAGWVCMDYGLPMVIFLYWDGKHIRAFVPYRGNCVDTVNKCMINEDYDNSAYFKKYYNIDMGPDFIYDLGEMLGSGDQFNFKDCLEEFEARLEAI